MDPLKVSEKQLEAIPGIGKKSAWNLVAARAKAFRKRKEGLPFDDTPLLFKQANVPWDNGFAPFFDALTHIE